MFSFPITVTAADSTGKTPPCVPWEKLMLHGEDQSPTEEQKKLSHLHESLLSSLQDEEAKDLVTALVFLSTRSSNRDKTKPEK